jgi:hypothetical protein
MRFRLPFALHLASLRRVHNHWNGSENTDTSQNPRENLDNLQLMTFSQSSLDTTNALVANYHTPHLVD